MHNIALNGKFYFNNFFFSNCGTACLPRGAAREGSKGESPPWSKGNSDIVVYGAAGKFMRHVTLMLIRAIRETGGRGQIVHLVSRRTGLSTADFFADLIISSENLFNLF